MQRLHSESLNMLSWLQQTQTYVVTVQRQTRCRTATSQETSSTVELFVFFNLVFLLRLQSISATESTTSQQEGRMAAVIRFMVWDNFSRWCTVREQKFLQQSWTAKWEKHTDTLRWLQRSEFQNSYSQSGNHDKLAAYKLATPSSRTDYVMVHRRYKRIAKFSLMLPNFSPWLSQFYDSLGLYFYGMLSALDFFLFACLAQEKKIGIVDHLQC